MYLDANNLYCWAMSQPIPTGRFKWLKEDKWDDIFKNKKELDILLNVISNIQRNFMINIMITPLPLKN